MNISAKGKYALQLLTYLGVWGNSGHPITLKQIAASEVLSDKYLWQVSRQLKAAGLIKSVSGPRGGFIMAMPASSITLAEALAVFDPELFRRPDSGEEARATNRTACSRVVEDKLKDLSRNLERMLISVTIGDLVEEYRSQETKASFYQI